MTLSTDCVACWLRARTVGSHSSWFQLTATKTATNENWPLIFKRPIFDLNLLFCWCREGGSNPHDRKDRRILSPLRLPVPPSRPNREYSSNSIAQMLSRVASASSHVQRLDSGRLSTVHGQESAWVDGVGSNPAISQRMVWMACQNSVSRINPEVLRPPHLPIPPSRQQRFLV